MEEREFDWARGPIDPRFPGKHWDDIPKWKTISPSDLERDYHMSWDPAESKLESFISHSHSHAPAPFHCPRGVHMHLGAVVPLYVTGPIEFIMDNKRPGNILPVLSVEDDTYITETGTYNVHDVSVVVPVILVDHTRAKPGDFALVNSGYGIDRYRYCWIKSIDKPAMSAEVVHIEMVMDSDGTLSKSYKESTCNLHEVYPILGEVPDEIKQQIRDGNYDEGTSIQEIEFMITPLTEEEFPRR